MAKKKQKLELTWIGKDEEVKLEPRILIEDPEKSYGDPDTENMLIHGDNLLALKALEQDFAGKIKCIYIDPPYNTGSAFEHYDDNLEHSTWLNLMSSRLKLLRTLLSKDGAIYIQIDDEEFAHLKVLCDEVFGRENFINCITVKTKSSAGASGGGEDKKLKKNTEFILLYARDRYNFITKTIFVEENLMDVIAEKKDDGKQFEYRQVLVNEGKKVEYKTIKDGSGEVIKIFKHENYVVQSVSQLVKTEGVGEGEIYFRHFEKIFRGQPAQSSIRTRVNEATGNDKSLFSIEYQPRSGKRKGQIATNHYLNCDLINWLSDTSRKTSNKIVKLEKLGTLWTDLSWNGLSAQGGVKFSNGKKPELLLQRIFELSTEVGDFVLDSFLGSGTTAAVAHKMGRKWIGIELGEHAGTHCLPRLMDVVDGEQSGISKVIDWKGGGGFKFYNLAPSLLKQDNYGNWVIDEKYNAAMLAHAMCKHEGFRFEPHAGLYWKQGKSTETDFIFVTTNYVTVEQLDTIHSEMLPGESLLICAKSFAPECENKYPSITTKKIPKMILGKCEFGKENYDLNIIERTEEVAEEQNDNE